MRIFMVYPVCRCNTPLVRSRAGDLYCVGCQMDVRRENSPTAAPPSVAKPTVSPPSPHATGEGNILAAAIAQQQQRGGATSPAMAPSIKRMHSPAGDAATKLPRIEHNAVPTTESTMGSSFKVTDKHSAAPSSKGTASLPPQQQAGDAGRELQTAPVVRAVMQTLLAKMLSVRAYPCQMSAPCGIVILLRGG